MVANAHGLGFWVSRVSLICIAALSTQCFLDRVGTDPGDAGTDGGSSDAGMRDAGPGMGDGGVDSGVTDGGFCGAGTRRCSFGCGTPGIQRCADDTWGRCEADPTDLIALYTFDGNLDDAIGDHDGTTMRSVTWEGEASDDCGQAMGMMGAGYGVVNDHADWDDAGRIDLWAWIAGDADMGILTRDASGSESSGHLSLSQRGSKIWMRLQDGSGTSAIRCIGPPSPRVWLDISMRFGDGAEPELVVNGQVASNTGCDMGPSSSVTTGIGGNANPWIFGADTLASVEPTALPLENYFSGRIDQVQIHRGRASASSPEVTGFVLVDGSGASVGPLIEGTTIDGAIRVRANTDPGRVGSVVFSLDGSPVIDNDGPYAVNLDPTSGTHTLTVTATTGSGGTGVAGPPLHISFTRL